MTFVPRARRLCVINKTGKNRDSQIYRNFLALTAVGVLAACTGGSPITSADAVGIGTGTQPLTLEAEQVEETTEAAGSPNIYGSEINSELTLNDLDYDPATDELVLNNLPFDGDNIYARNAAVSASVGSAFGVYENVGGNSNYYAVFRRAGSGYSQVGTVGTDRYLSFGFGGVAAQRLDGSGALPAANTQYLFTGEYAAVRTIIDPTTGSQVQYVAGTAQIDVDIADFDTTGAVEGVIVNRRFFDNNGVQLTALDTADFISLATGEINFDNWTIASSTATAVSLTTGQSGASGTWQGLFAGPNGEEVAGIVVVSGSGPVGIDPATGDFIEVQVRETGGFIATR